MQQVAAEMYWKLYGVDACRGMVAQLPLRVKAEPLREHYEQ